MAPSETAKNSIAAVDEEPSLHELERTSIQDPAEGADSDIASIEVDSLMVKSAAEQAVADGRPFFTIPEVPVIPGKLVTLFYNGSRGILPGGAELLLKYGTNKWEDTYELKMERDKSLDGEETEWWRTDLQTTDDIFRLDFLFEDSLSGFVDNNLSLDYQLELKNCLTEEEVLERRLKEIEKYEEERKEKMSQEAQKYRYVMTVFRTRVAEWFVIV